MLANIVTGFGVASIAMSLIVIAACVAAGRADRRD